MNNKKIITEIIEINNEMITFNEKNNYQYHIDAIRDIESQLKEYNININYNATYDFQESAYYHALNNIIVIETYYGDTYQINGIYLPEKLSENQKNFVINYIQDLNPDDLLIQQVDGDNLKNLEINDLIKNKQKIRKWQK